MSMNVLSKEICVIGMGASGTAAALWLHAQGARVRVTEEKSSSDRSQCLKDSGIAFEMNGHTESFLEGVDLFVVSPGVPSSALPLKFASKYRIPVMSEIECAFRFCPSPIVAITGTNGKTTTTALIGHILKEARMRHYTCGNIGTPFSEVLPRLGPEDRVVLEVSSFQLEKIHDFVPDIAILLNIDEDHKDRHPEPCDYLKAKLRIFENQTSDHWLIASAEHFESIVCSPSVQSRVLLFSTDKELEQGAWYNGTHLVIRLPGRKDFLLDPNLIPLPGRYNWQNVFGAVLTALIWDIEPEIIRTAIASFQGLPHRLEFVRDFQGRRFFDDSKATNPAAVARALESFSDPVVWIAGGRNKNMDFSSLCSTVKKHVKQLIAIGETQKEFENLFADVVPLRCSGSMQDAVRVAWELSREGDVVLLSPACASFDMFRDYKERGNVFKKYVVQLVSELRKVVPSANNTGASAFGGNSELPTV